MGFQVQVSGKWGGSVGGWRPAITGTLNGTGDSDEEVSTCASFEEAQYLLDAVVLPEVSSDPYDGDPRWNAPRFRILDTVSGDVRS